MHEVLPLYPKLMYCPIGYIQTPKCLYHAILRNKMAARRAIHTTNARSIQGEGRRGRATAPADAGSLKPRPLPEREEGVSTGEGEEGLGVSGNKLRQRRYILEVDLFRGVDSS